MLLTHIPPQMAIHLLDVAPIIRSIIFPLRTDIHIRSTNPILADLTFYYFHLTFILLFLFFHIFSTVLLSERPRSTGIGSASLMLGNTGESYHCLPTDHSNQNLTHDSSGSLVLSSATDCGHSMLPDKNSSSCGTIMSSYDLHSMVS
ncbi:unnamed protein product [Protopolystoma xenopodis]|uniref:Uncharacterized protein n=1 Tax=Protopolystoma xenopodis TaxID=117903 RepID=A0A448X599_9PLAT|nr:unnamed protein product [Protopolystoma xenopodis]